jgi:hypothetical protein
MTNPQQDTVSNQANAALETTEEGPGLDAELVKDLELADDADDVRGGPCSHSNTSPFLGQ